MTFRICIFLLVAGWMIATPGARAQSPLNQAGTTASSNESLREQAAAALDSARAENLDLLSPGHFEKAQQAYKEARSLIENNREQELIRIKLKLTVDEVAAAREAASGARKRWHAALAERTAARAAGADTISASLWKRAEERLQSSVRKFENDPAAVDTQIVTDVAGAFRAARRDALRIVLLKDARDKIDDVERSSGSRMVPALMLRAQQALSRAEADLAQENIEGARNEAQNAVRIAGHAQALMAYMAAAQKTRQPWESALLPYDDLLEDIASHLGGNLDLTKGGAATGPQLLNMIDARQESLATKVTEQSKMQMSLESALAETQTNLANAQSRIAELERRLNSAEGERSTARESLQQHNENADRIARAQTILKPGDATFIQNPNGTVTIRLIGLKYGAGATNLDKTRQKVVDRAVEAMAQFPGATIQVDGFTDSEGSDEANLKASEARAQNVAKYLAQKLNLKPDQIPGKGYGKANPLASNDTPEGRAQNRRIEIVLTMPR
jgi:OmpA-OmpF porin, OOP family